MKILRDYKTINKLEDFIKNAKFSNVEKYSEHNRYNVTESFVIESIEPHDLYIVANIVSEPRFLGKGTYVGSFCDYVIYVYDPQFKILNKKDSPNKEISEKNTILAKRITKMLAKTYYRGK